MPADQTKPPLRTLVEALICLESREARDEFLDFSCRDQPELRARLERLLALRHKADGYFDLQSSAAAQEHTEDDSSEGEGTKIGRYRLLGRLGEGGCGVVYLAEQQEPVKRRVALKIIRLGMDTENVIARFELERQALAMMDHPNIARVLDVGATRSGRPYFVMQLVDGEKITDYCDEMRLGIPERLKLFIRICHAVQHAHQKGVVHCDIKPSNIIVWEHDGEAIPKVIDFGIAKATAVGLDEQVTATIDGQFVGTPAYMSPEQASRADMDVDTRSDIYSLGALLYELLSGRPPFDSAALRRSSVEEIRHLLRDTEPSRPSVAVEELGAGELSETAARRGCEPHKLAGRIRGDLDRIVMKAMAKDRQHRYSSADALAADGVCFLNHEPVSARPPGGFYRLGKLVRRNKLVCSAGAIVVFSLVLGLGTATAMFLRANRDRKVAEHARQVAEEARANEAALRKDAEIGRNISHAAVLVKYDKFQEADQLLAEIPPEKAKPSLESAETFRALGHWHAREGRWKQAAERFTALAYSLTSADKADSENISIDLQPAASSLVEAGELAGYERLRAMALERFGNSSNPIVAEQVVKPCLLTPASPEILDGFAHLEEVMIDYHASHWATTPFERNLAAWREFAIALMEYRKGNLDLAERWVGKCTTFTNENRSRDAAAWAVRAMTRYRQRHLDQARQDLAAVHSIVDPVLATEGGIFAEQEPAWQDWLNACALMREADAMMAE